MRTILVPTDYSEAARNAVHYAADLAKVMGGKLLLFHAYHVPMRLAAGGGAVPASGEELEAEEARKLRNYTEAVKSLYPGITIGHSIRAGFAVEEINDYASGSDIDLVVMGTGAESEHNDIFGSLTTSVIKDTKGPVMVVPQDATFKPKPRVALAYDFSGISNPYMLDMLGSIVKSFGSELMIVDVLKSEEEKVKMDGSLERLTAQIPHSFHFPVGDDPAETMLNFIEENKVDMLAAIPHKHGFFARLVRNTFTQKMALHTHVPLLTLPG
jgi:nucleotide-binding universal stress UspA family protein